MPSFIFSRKKATWAYIANYLSSGRVSVQCHWIRNTKYQDSKMTGIFSAVIKKNTRQNHRNVILVPWSLKSRGLMWKAVCELGKRVAWNILKTTWAFPERVWAAGDHRNDKTGQVCPLSVFISEMGHDRTRQSYSISICLGASWIIQISF